MIVIKDEKGRYFSQFDNPKVGGFMFPSFVTPTEGYPVQIAVFKTNDEALRVLTLVMDAVSRSSFLVGKHGAVGLEDLSKDELEKKVAALEALRPHWAQGYTDDGQAAASKTSALVGLWGLLGVDNQTAAMQRLRKLLELEKT